MDQASTEAAIVAAVDELTPELIRVSRDIHARPELAFEERYACQRLCDAATQGGLTPRLDVYSLPTAFEARIEGTGAGPVTSIIAEYDALPNIGHACGHNLIATAALGASLALARVSDQWAGTVQFLGTPAEERGGGKELMARAGAFEGVDAALMIHPSGVNLSTMPCICLSEVKVVYRGKSAHASAMPHKGLNALDGLLLAYQAISNLRQHIRPSERIHGIITDGGQAPNIVPERAAGEFYVRAESADRLAALKPRVQSCFEAGATGTGCEVDIEWQSVDYLDLNTNWPLAAVFQKHAEGLGREFLPIEKIASGFSGSTDMGNVSYRVPSIHPMLASAPRNVVIHNPEFAEWAGSEMGDAAAVDGAKSLALTAAEFLNSQTLQQASRKAFEVSQGLA